MGGKQTPMCYAVFLSLESLFDLLALLSSTAGCQRSRWSPKIGSIFGKG